MSDEERGQDEHQLLLHQRNPNDSLHGAGQTDDVQRGNDLKEDRGDYSFENLAGSQIIRIFAK